ncbi:MAG TPA: flagellar biosynthetic protein FliR, partial [Acidisphaera sp.]|nr:flagellar biosynthetic protein FliR [Acidisphaera sp.]
MTPTAILTGMPTGIDDLRGQLPTLAHALMLVLARVGTVAMLLPGVGESETPMTVRAGWAFALTLVLFPVVAPLLPAMPAGPAPLAAELAAEIVTGLWLGWLTRLAVMAMPMAGGVISYMTGLSSVLHPSTDGGGQNPELSQLFTLAIPVIVLATGLYALPLRALVGSYSLIAPLRQEKSWKGEWKRNLKPFEAIQRVRPPPGRGAARQPEASLAWETA